MPVSWTIAGQAGRTFDATARSLESASISSAKLEFKSLEADTLTFTISPSPTTGAIFPDLVQEMILYRNGVQFFVGYVTNVRTLIDSMNQSVEVTVSGAWWWLEKVPFSANYTINGTTGERIFYVFGTASDGQNLQTSLQSAINTCAGLGVPIASIAQGSSVDAMFAVPRITLNQSTCGQVISELVSICPDAMVWFDYSTKPVRMRITRRGNAATTDLDASSSPITSFDINPVIELQVSQVVLPYLDRDAQGRTRFQTQSSGTNYLSQKQIITISGPELDTFLPNDLFDSYSIKTIGLSGTPAANFVHDKDTTLVSVAAKYGLGRVPVSIESGGTYSVKTSTSFAASTYYRTVAGPRLVLKDNTSISTSTAYIVTSQTNIPDWVSTEKGIAVYEATYSGLLKWLSIGKSYNASGYYFDCGFESSLSLSGYDYYGGVAQMFYYGWKPFSIPVTVVGYSYPTATTLYRPADYSFINPPANLAANLLAAQNWLPYEGSIQLGQEDVGGTRYRGTKVNIANSLSRFASMGALVSGESLDIETGRTTIDLGAPARNDYRTLVDKIRKTSQDNIVYV
jgi:hypothetical protein